MRNRTRGVLRDDLQSKAHQVIQFWARLSDGTETTWLDDFGSYRIRVGEGILEKELAELKKAAIIVSDFVKDRIATAGYVDLGEQRFDCLVSIGASETHATASKLCLQLGCPLITVPIPLANDAFCTNRCGSQPDSPSYSSVYPVCTIIDIAHLTAFPMGENVSGLGEFVGLYCSAIDYCASRGASTPENLPTFVAESFADLCEAYHSDYGIFLKKLACCLIAKCILMRVNLDHQIGCGIDHLFARYLVKAMRVPHGKAVYWGAILALALFPEWEDFGLDLATLISCGIDTGLILPREACLITSLGLPDAIRFSLNTRPGRPTMLSSPAVLDWRCESAVDRLQSTLAVVQLAK